MLVSREGQPATQNNIIAKSLSEIKIGDEEIKIRAENMFEELADKINNTDSNML